MAKEIISIDKDLFMDLKKLGNPQDSYSTIIRRLIKKSNKNRNHKVLVTGNQGYIGRVLTNLLVFKGYDVKGLDAGYFTKQDFYTCPMPHVEQIRKDVRDITKEDIKDCDSIIHLAALSNDPSGELNPELTNEINHLATVRLAKLAKSVGVEKFIFSSSCSIYGQAKKELLNEESPFNPVSAYAKSKISSEKALNKLSDSSFCPVYLRNSTVYGLSPKMRFDLVINNLTAWGYLTGKIKILSSGTQQRPLIHINDVSNAFIAALKADCSEVRNEAFNIGIQEENFSVSEMAQMVQKELSDTEIEYANETNFDARSYKVDFSKAKEVLKHFKPEWNVPLGIKELNLAFEGVNFDFGMFEHENYSAIKNYKKLLAEGQVGPDLRWVK